ncbi:dihydrolipoamide acetyltransferase family protein [Caldilinea sp.]|uniref:dihydrolipoamide acetyltransferase family protein n=1 Tax=Caldilinea sp. TaxID=2293560 RepID=UPI0021DE7A6E|nr:dihydrolipoamide acetyltransferase family protein [Caldilinea sp.]GIV68307.1 MAG: acetyltransferase component of pyruvate dehydrogenase complex [Caldilinea sp.]
MAEFLMPSLGADMQSGKLLEWLVKPGDVVKRGQVIAVVGTEKGDIEVEVFEEGVVRALLAAPGAEMPVGAPIAVIEAVGEAGKVAAPAAMPAAEAKMAAAPTPAVKAAEPVARAANGHRIRVSPLARKLAAELGVDLSQVQGTGPQGAIDKADVERAAAALKAQREAQQAAPAQVAEAPPSPAKPVDKSSAEFQAGMRRAIALAMARSNRDIPHYYLETRINMAKALAWLEAENLKRPIQNRLLPAVLLIKAVAKALTHVPQLNGYWVDDALQVAEAIHIGFAIALRQGGLVTPAIHHADLKSADELMETLRDLIMRTRAGRLRSSELTDATITVTSLGDMGVEKVFGVIYPPQVALVGFGKVTEEVWVENGMIGVRPVVHATLAGDHRATDGRTGAEFLDVLNRLLQEPEALFNA